VSLDSFLEEEAVFQALHKTLFLAQGQVLRGLVQPGQLRLEETQQPEPFLPEQAS
jgi:hypothetical protein